MKSVIVAAMLAATAIAVPAQAATLEVVSGSQRGFILGAFGNSAGQSFTAIDTNLTSFGFQFSLFNAQNANVAYTFTLLNGAGLGGSTVATRSFTLPNSLTSTTPTWFDFDITGTNVTAGQTYTAVLTSSNSRFGLYMGPSININTGAELTGDAYAGGRAYFAQEVYPNCARTGNCDLNFRVTGTTATAAVPEPASWALMLGGFALVGGTLRRRRATLSYRTA